MGPMRPLAALSAFGLPPRCLWLLAVAPAILATRYLLEPFDPRLHLAVGWLGFLGA